MDEQLLRWVVFRLATHERDAGLSRELGLGPYHWVLSGETARAKELRLLLKVVGEDMDETERWVREEIFHIEAAGVLYRLRTSERKAA